jgi:hypothetical protein
MTRSAGARYSRAGNSVILKPLPCSSFFVSLEPFAHIGILQPYALRNFAAVLFTHSSMRPSGSTSNLLELDAVAGEMNDGSASIVHHIYSISYLPPPINGLALGNVGAAGDKTQ